MLPIHTLPIVERWDCHQCGFCCRGSIVPLTAHDIERLIAQGWAEHPDFKNVQIIAPSPGRRDGYELGKQADTSCVFLMADGLCRIHKELGFEAKPLICRMFPLQLIPQEKQVVLTLRRACPSAAADRGRAISEYLPTARAYAAEGQLVEEGVAAPAIKAGEESDWKRARIVLEALRRITSDERYPPVRRLVHGLEFCRLLEAANTNTFDNSKLTELVAVLEQHLADESAPYFAERQSPGRVGRVLFRQTALDVLRLHPRVQHAATWRNRWNFAVWAWKMFRGRGATPRVHEHFPVTNFARLEEPLGRLDPHFYDAFAQYFATTTASYQYAVANKNGWSIVESFRQLALFYPLGLWLLRWVAAERTPTADDVYEIICALDRAQGYAPLTGASQRRRLDALAELGQLPTLAAWYGR